MKNLMLLIAVAIIPSMANAKLTEANSDQVAASDFAICVESKLLQMGVDPRMQNRWNPHRIAGKLQIKAIGLCEGEMKMGAIRPKQERPAQVLPARSNESLGGGGQGIREI